MGRSFREKPCEPARWSGMSGRMANPAPKTKNENVGEEKHRSETQTAKFRRQKWENWNRCSGYESQGIKWCWKRTSRKLSMKSKRTVFEGSQVQNRHQKPLHLLDHQHTVVEVRRGKRTSEAGVHLGSSLDSRAKITWTVLAPIHFVIIGILPNVNSTNLNRVVNSVTSAHLHTGRLKVNPARIRRRMVTKVQWQYWKIHDSWVAYFRTQSRRDLYRFYGRAQKSWDQFDACHAASRKHPRKRRSVTRKKSSQSSSSAQSVRFQKFEDRSQEETERQERSARGDAWRLAKNILKLKEKDKATFFSSTNEWCLPAPSVTKQEEHILL